MKSSVSNLSGDGVLARGRIVERQEIDRCPWFRSNRCKTSAPLALMFHTERQTHSTAY